MDTVDRPTPPSGAPLGRPFSETPADSGQPAGTGLAVAQRTLRQAISCVGIGRHAGVRVSLTLHPAPPDSGVRLRRSDRPAAPALAATPHNLLIAEHAMVLADGDGMRIVGIEHVVAALAMTGIDNVLIEVSGPELPAMDGSAQPFVFLIECAGASEQAASRRPCVPPAPIELRSGAAMARLLAASRPRLASDLEGSALAGHGPDRHVVALERAALRHELAAARQPLTLAALSAARERGLMRGVSHGNTLILAPDGPSNPGGLRFADEPARHANVLALAALSLLGGLPEMALESSAAGHALLARLMRRCVAGTKNDGAAIGMPARVGSPA